MPPLTLRLLGRPVVTHDGMPVHFPTRKALGLLAYLAAEGVSCTREQAIALFWPDSDVAHGQAALRRTLVHLRQALAERDHANGAGHLAAGAASLALRAGDLELDLSTLRDAWALARRPGGIPSAIDRGPAGERRAAKALLRAGSAAYGGAFCAGLSIPDAPDFETWCDSGRVTWRARVTEVFDRLARLDLEDGDPDAAVNTAERWLEVEPLDEAAYRLLIQLQLAAGDGAAARRTFEACRAVLAAELGAEPSAETVALLEQQRPAAQRPLPAAPVQPAAKRWVLGAHLAGREDELARLGGAMRAVAGGVPQAVVVAGEAGIGKTRLIDAFLAVARSFGTDVLHGRAFETGGHLPYQAVTDALRLRIEHENAPDDLLSNAWLAELSRLFPELRDRYPDLPSPLADPDAAVGGLFEAVARLTAAFGGRAPMVLVVDDLQWADTGSLDLLHYVARRWRSDRSRALLLFAVRSEALASTPALREWLTSLARELPVTRVDLQPLTRAETLDLVREAAAPPDVQRPAAGVVTAEAFAGWLYEETGGQPLFMHETIQSLLEQGGLQTRRTAGGTLGLDLGGLAGVGTLAGGPAPGVREVIRTRVERLSTAGQAVVAAAAVLGHDFSFGALCTVAGLSEDVGLAALDEALATGGIVAPTPGAAAQAPPAYSFGHDRVRDVVYTEAGEARRRVFHRRALETLQATAPAARLAYHALAAGSADQAFHWSVAAGVAALRLFAAGDAVAHFRQALALFDELSSDGAMPALLSQDEVVDLFSELGRAQQLLGDYPAAYETYTRMRTIAGHAALPAIEALARNRLAALATLDPRGREAVAGALEEVRRGAADTEDDATLAEAECNLAQLQFFEGQPGSAFDHGQRALALARAAGVREIEEASLNVLGHIAGGLRRWEEALDSGTRALALARELEDVRLEADCLSLCANLQLVLGQMSEGVAGAREALAIGRRIGDPMQVATAAFNLAPGLTDTGFYAEARRVAEAGLATAEQMKLPSVIGFLLAALGNVHRGDLALPLAVEQHGRLAEISERDCRGILRELAAAELCADHALAGDWEQAAGFAREAIEARRGRELNVPFMGFTRYLETEALVRADAYREAADDAAAFGERFGHNPRYRLAHLRALAVLAQHNGDDPGALDYLTEAAAASRALGLAAECWQITAAISELQRSRGDLVEARAAAEEATAVAHRLAGQMDEDQRGTFLHAPLIVGLARPPG